MNFLECIRQWTQKKKAYHPGPETSALREALDAGQRAKRAEDYPRALDALETAASLAHKSRDATAVAVIALNQAEVYIRQKRWTEAHELLQKTYRNAQETHQETQMAYLLNAQGMLAQAQQDWEAAARYYEQALTLARSANALGAEGRALGLLADTYLHDSNASYAIHLLREALPKLNMTGDIELSSAFVGRLGEALIISGHEEEGGQLLERALRLARQMNYRTYERHWSAVLGKRQAANGHYQGAYAHLVHVLTLSPLDEPAAEIVDVLCALSKTSLSLRQTTESLEYAEQAVHMSEQLGDSHLVARARGTMGIALLAARQPADAIPHLQAAADHLAVGEGDVTSQEIDLLRSLAAAQGDSSQDDKAIETYQRAAARAGSHNHYLELAGVRRDLGLLYLRRWRMADAIHEWTAALAVYESERQTAQAARLLCDIGGVRRFLGQGQRAMRDYEQALMTINALNDDWETRGLVLSNAANMYADQGDLESAESFFSESIAIARRLNNEAAEATRQGNYGWFLLSTGKPQQAISTLEYALRQSQSLGLHLQTAIQTANLGLAYHLLGSEARALDYHQQAINLIQPLDNPHWEHIFKVNLAETLLEGRDIPAARPLLEAALRAAQAISDIELIIRARIGLGRLAVEDGRPTDAAPHLEEAVSLSRKADLRRCLADALSAQSRQQAALHNPARAESLWEEARKWYQMLHSPLGKSEPVWLHGKTAEPGLT